jgi:hypothetical protein
MEILLGYYAFVFCFFLIGTLILFALEKILVICFEQLKELLYPTPTVNRRTG